MALDPSGFAARTRHGRWMDSAAQSGLASIIIPTFNRASLLDEALASAIGQSYRPIEILVVDDGSTDDTAAVVSRRQEELRGDPDVSLRYVRQANSGVSSARNHGLIESTGEFIQFLDSDNILFSEKLRLQIACLRRYPEAGFAFSEMISFGAPAPGEPPPVDSAVLVQSADQYGDSDILTMEGIYRRRVCCEVGPWSEDKEYNFRVLLCAEQIVHLPGRLCALRDHGGPRLTDSYSRSAGLPIRLRASDRMTELAKSENCLNNQRLIAALSKRYMSLITDALELGQKDIVAGAIRSYRTLPISPARRLRLAVYQVLNALPAGVFRVCWPLWVKVRRGLARARKRESPAG